MQDKHELMSKLGKKQLRLQLHEPLTALPEALSDYDLELHPSSAELVYTYDTQAERTGITLLLSDLNKARITVKDLDTTQSSLEDIFVNLVKKDP